jgi:hypothetical protein
MTRIPFINGDEQDALTKWKSVYNWRPGQRKRVKRRYNRRMRRIVKRESEFPLETCLDYGALQVNKRLGPFPFESDGFVHHTEVQTDWDVIHEDGFT